MALDFFDLEMEPFLYESLSRPARRQIRRLWEEIVLGRKWRQWAHNREGWVRRCLRLANYEPSMAEVHSIIGHAETLRELHPSETDPFFENIESYLEEIMGELDEKVSDDDFQNIIFLALLSLLSYLYVQWSQRHPGMLH